MVDVLINVFEMLPSKPSCWFRLLQLFVDDACLRNTVQSER